MFTIFVKIEPLEPMIKHLRMSGIPIKGIVTGSARAIKTPTQKEKQVIQVNSLPSVLGKCFTNQLRNHSKTYSFTTIFETPTIVMRIQILIIIAVIH